VLAALRAGERPTDVAAKSPFTEAYVRKLARENGIPEYLVHQRAAVLTGQRVRSCRACSTHTR
jgi:hypothetical protein